VEGTRNYTHMKKTTLTLICLVALCSANGQDPVNYNKQLYDTYVKGEIGQWKEIISEMSRDYEITDSQNLLYDLCFAYYGYIGYLISKEEDKAAKEVLEDAVKKTKKLEKELDSRPDVLALQGALLGYRIVLSKFSSMFLGPKALKYIKTAYESASTCFNCNVEMGNMKFYTPKFLGGSKTEAIPYYKKAVDLLETSTLKSDRNWIYMNTVLLLANAYKETGQQENACQLYKHLLEYEPAAEWIRKDLYSKCRTK
jgi:tetratricopeptide (TPR) repeat protein